MKEPMVISLGGSVIVPQHIAEDFLRRFARFVQRLKQARRVVVICGGGQTARSYVNSGRAIGVRREPALHWIGVRACQLNGELVRAVLGVRSPLVFINGRTRLPSEALIVGVPHQAGGTSDLRSIRCAHIIGAKTVVNITNVDGVYTHDPRRVRSARLLTALSWKHYGQMFKRAVRPGMHFPFDPIAARLAARHHMKVFVLSNNVGNLAQAIAGKPFRGTVLGPY